MDDRIEKVNFNKAKGYALRLIKLRPRTEYELRVKFAQKMYSEEIADQLISYCKDSGLLDDGLFAKVWLQSRLKKYGLRRVRHELAAKGLSEQLILSETYRIKADYDEESVVRGLMARRIKVYQGLPALTKKKRMMDYLLRRGFSLETINKVVREL